MEKKEKNKNNKIDELNKLRESAEEILKNRDIKDPELGNKTLEELMHEIKVHQIELEIQNDELIRSQRELEISRNMYSDLFDFAPIGYFTLNANGIILQSNLAGANMVGIDKSNLIMKPLSMFIESRYHQTFYNHLNNTIYSGSKQKCELMISDRYNNEVYIQMESSAIEKNNDNNQRNIRTAVIDITERKKAEIAHRKAEERYKAVIQDQTELICRCNTSWILTFINDAYCKFFNINKDERVGCSLENVILNRKIFTQERLRDLKNELGHLAVDKPFTEIEHQVDIDGEKKWVKWNIRAITGEDDKIIEYQAVGRDITKQKTAEEKLNQTLRNLEYSNKELENFAQIVSHDLRSPLNTIISYLNIIDRKYKSIMDDKGIELTDMMRERVNGMMNLISDILTYSRIDREKSDFQMVNAQDILLNAQENLKSRIYENDAVITGDNLSEFYCNRTQMISVFQNLIDNSIKYCEHTPKIHITMEERKNNWLSKFTDNGIGIDPENNEKIFLIFHQEKEKSSNYQGYGIGLAYCKKIIERHGGQIWIDSDIGKGSTFYFTISRMEKLT